MNTTPNKSSTNSLILGATGSIGYAVTTNLLARQLPVTILVRNKAKAEALFPNASTLTTVEGDVQNTTLLNGIAADKTHIFHGINYPYHQWFGNMQAVTQKVIDAASLNSATVVFPGNIYNFGNRKEPIREDSQPRPITRKGQLRVEIEAMLEQAAQVGRCRVLNVRLPDFWGPNVLHESVAPIFEGALHGKALPWLLNADVPHQAVYTPDAAEIIARLMLHQPTQLPVAPYEVWNYGGTVLPSARAWFGQISELVGKSLSTRVYSRFTISFLGLFIPILREVKEMLYLYENTVLLDDTKVREAFPDFRPTPMRQALTDTLSWFAQHRLQRSFTPVSTANTPVVA
ncbi:NAD(P)H-binding protein [Spirosoma soli]|uniref:NAD(P)H-binding protein n=1 Tax=Spirosoma soli TaxID=1770529 RepID=A0ABW5M0W4_9BACT